MSAPVGLIAAAGRFPVLFAEKAKECGVPVICIGMDGMADASLIPACAEYHSLRRLSMGFAFRTFRKAGVKQFTFAGKYHKKILFQPWRWLRLMPDWRTLKFWFDRKRQDNADDSLMLGIIAEFRKEGLECVSALDLVPELLVKDGILTRRPPTAKEAKDIEFGWMLAKEMGRLDVGQSVMVRDRAVLAVEAIEGTDLAIRRAGELCGKTGFVMVKVAKPQQDMRFDVPTVGVTTIETLHAAGGQVLAVEAGKTIILDEPATLKLADRYGITIVAKAA
jgi:UDP-2,3-diacylglucosamine hydrolase